MPWNLGLKVMISSDDCSALFATAPLVWKTATWDGGGTLTNLGYAGPTYDMTVVAGGFDWSASKVTYYSPGGTPWSAFGGEPGDAPITVVVALLSDNLDAYGNLVFYGPDGGGSSLLGGMIQTGFGGPEEEMVQWGYGEKFFGPVSGAATSFHDNQPATVSKLYTVEIDPTTGIITNRMNNTVIPSDFGYNNVYGAGYGTFLNNEWGTSVSEGYDFTIGFPDLSPGPTAGEPWEIGGMAMVRGLLTDEQRAAWYACLSGEEFYYLPTSSSFLNDHIIHDGTRFISVDTAGTLGISSDGQSWSTNFVSTTLGTNIASKGGRIATVNNLSAEEIKTTDDDGVSWTTRATLIGFSLPSLFNSARVGNIETDGAGFVVCGNASTGSGNNVYYSSSGTSWTGVHVGATSTAVNFSFVRHMAGTYYMAGSQSGTTLLYKSTDRSTWNALTAPAVTVVNFPFMWALNGRLIYKTVETSSSTPPRLWSSTNEGSSWTEHTHSMTDIIDIAYDYANDQYVLIDEDGDTFIGSDLDSIAASADALPWDNNVIYIASAPSGAIAGNGASNDVWSLFLAHLT